MVIDNSIKWIGIGRWFLFVVVGFLIVLVIFFVFDYVSGVVVGWNIFLGFLLCGVIVFGNVSVFVIVMIIVVFIVVRLLVVVVFDVGLVDIVVGVFLFVIVSVFVWDLRK